MEEKIPVIIEPMQRTKYAFKNLDYCTQCGSYTTLRGNNCLKCSENKFISFEKMIDEMYNKKNRKDILMLLNIFLVGIILGGVVFSVNLKHLVISLCVLTICLGTLIIIQKKFARKLKIFEVHETIEKERYMLERAIERDYQQINGLLEDQAYLDAYKALRDIGTIVKKEHIKTAKIHCLNRFTIRSDMALELDELLLKTYNKNLVDYIYEVSKYQRSLIKQPSIEYIVQSEAYIQEDFENADLILGNIAGAAIYSRGSIDLNKEFIISYIEHIPTDRLGRLERLLYSNTKYDWDTLKQAISNKKGPSYEEL